MLKACVIQETAMLAGATSFMTWSEMGKEIRQMIGEFRLRMWPRANWDHTFPSVARNQLSYASLLHLLKHKMVKRVNLLADGKIALIEVGTTSALDLVSQLNVSLLH